MELRIAQALRAAILPKVDLPRRINFKTSNLATTYFRWHNANYHGPWRISLLSSEWDQVGHPQYSHQVTGFKLSTKVLEQSGSARVSNPTDPSELRTYEGVTVVTTIVHTDARYVPWHFSGAGSLCSKTSPLEISRRSGAQRCAPEK